MAKNTKQALVSSTAQTPIAAPSQPVSAALAAIAAAHQETLAGPDANVIALPTKAEVTPQPRRGRPRKQAEAAPVPVPAPAPAEITRAVREEIEAAAEQEQAEAAPRKRSAGAKRKAASTRKPAARKASAKKAASTKTPRKTARKAQAERAAPAEKIELKARKPRRGIGTGRQYEDLPREGTKMDKAIQLLLTAGRANQPIATKEISRRCKMSRTLSTWDVDNIARLTKTNVVATKSSRGKRLYMLVPRG